jgi:hypothetical protein
VSRNGRSPGAVARRASAEFCELVGRQPEAVISLDRTDDGWRVGIEVLELRRVPSTADLLAEYELDVDDDGELVGYRRIRRYARAQARSQS